MSLDRAVNMQQQQGESDREIRQEAPGKITKISPCCLGQILIVMLLCIAEEGCQQACRTDPSPESELLTLLRKTRSRSRTDLPSYLRYLPRLSSKDRSIAFCQSSPTMSRDLDSRVTNVSAGGSLSMISKRSLASQMNSSRFCAFQKNGCSRTDSAVGLCRVAIRQQGLLVDPVRNSCVNVPFSWITSYHSRNQVLHFHSFFSQSIQPFEREFALKNVHLALVPPSERVLATSQDVVEDAAERKDVDRPGQSHAWVSRRTT